jgi:hypothetical protein
MCAPEELQLPRQFAIEERHSAPTPQFLVHLSEFAILFRPAGNKNASLRHRGLSVSAGLEENRPRAIFARLFHHNHLFEWSTFT